MLRFLITGTGGFVGRHVVAALVRTLGPDDRLVGIGRQIPEVPPDDPESRVSYRRLDLLDAPELSSFVAAFRPTHILHLAGMASVHQASGSPAETWRANVLASLNLAEAVAEGAPGATLLFASSGEVYGRAFLNGESLAETAIPIPGNAYARTKFTTEQMLADILPAAGVKLIVARPFNHIGPGQDERFVVPSFASQIALIEAGLREPVVKVGDLSARRDFLDVADVVAAYTGLLARSSEIADGAIFNIASGRARPISELLDIMRAQARVPFEIRVDPDRLRKSEIPTASGDAHALASVIGWRPEISLSTSLAAVLDEARSKLAVAS